MRWHRRKTEPAVPPPEHAEAAEALSKADEIVQRTQDADEEINAVTIQLVRYGKRNNFTHMLAKALKGPEPHDG